MDAKQAIAVGRDYLQEMLGDQFATPPRLEEIWYDDARHIWSVTFGFYRVANPGTLGAFAFNTFEYKVVSVDAREGKATAIRNRAEAPA